MWFDDYIVISLNIILIVSSITSILKIILEYLSEEDISSRLTH